MYTTALFYNFTLSLSDLPVTFFFISNPTKTASLSISPPSIYSGARLFRPTALEED